MNSLKLPVWYLIEVEECDKVSTPQFVVRKIVAFVIIPISPI